MDKISRAYILKKIKKWFKNEFIFVVALIFALISFAFLPKNIQSTLDPLGGIDFKLISLLLCLMAIVKGFSKLGLFNVLSQTLLTRVKSTRGLCLILVLLCFFSSMLVTNSVALVAFVPFTILVLTSVGWQDKLVFTLCLQTVAANAGGMLTPFGNAQNLYLFSFYNMSVGHFFAICLPTVAVAILVIILLVILKPSGNIKINFPRKHKLHNKKLFCLYCILFLICILCVFRVLPWYIMLATVTLCVFVFDREAILRIDWLFLVTLCLFFVISNNISQMPFVAQFLTDFLQGREFVTSLVLSQFVGNVPAAILLSGFTANADALLLGTNIATFGTLNASMASLLGYKMYIKSENARPLVYFLTFSVINVVLLVICSLMALLFFI